VFTYCAENSQTRVRILPQGNVDISAALANEIATAYATNRYVIHKLQRIGMHESWEAPDMHCDREIFAESPTRPQCLPIMEVVWTPDP